MNSKLTTRHRERKALVYIRQSTARQVLDHGESTARQYALGDRAKSLGWPASEVEIIDEDLGRSGASTEARPGFRRLVRSVADGSAGALFALEVSRLARSSGDWQQLIRLCAAAGVAIVDADTVYNPSNGDDKLLLDLKGTMSEAELHWLGLRLTGARRNKAARGELRLQPPTGYCWTEAGYEVDADDAVRGAVEVLFARFDVEPSANAVVKWAHRCGFLVPTRVHHAGGLSSVIWVRLSIARMISLLRNPVYAGAYAYSREPLEVRVVDGKIVKRKKRGLAPDKWGACVRDAHPGYITWERYMHNRDKLVGNRMQHLNSKTPPRDGLGLLTQLLVCGRCGRRMQVHQSGNGTGRYSYTCRGERDTGAGSCWAVPGPPLDKAVEEAFFAAFTPDGIELALAVQHEVSRQTTQLDEQWRRQLERAEYQASLAERRYMAVDPDNRTVARKLEQMWERRLAELSDLSVARDEAAQRKQTALTDDDKRQIRALARDLPRVWASKTTRPSERKAMLALVAEAISLSPVEVPARETLVKVLWRTGREQQLRVPRPNSKQRLATDSATVERLAALSAKGLRDEAVADELNKAGVRTAQGKLWTMWAVRWVRQRYKVTRHYEDLPRARRAPERFEDGAWSVKALSAELGVDHQVVRRWIRQGVLPVEKRRYAGRHRSALALTVSEPLMQTLRSLAKDSIARMAKQRGNEEQA